MRGNIAIPAHTLMTFLLVMARMGGVMLFIPMPGLKTGPAPARVIFAASTALMMYPVWPKTSAAIADPTQFWAAMLSEALLGIGVGLCVAFVSEMLVMAAQIVSFQAGYSYASTIDPATEAEAGYLPIVAQLFAGLLFFAIGLDRQILLALAGSFHSVPPGGFFCTPTMLEAMVQGGSMIFSTGLRLALPVLALLVMTDISLALMGRLNTQLQVTSMAFPAKMVIGLGLLAWTASLYPVVFRDSARRSLELAYRLLR